MKTHEVGYGDEVARSHASECASCKIETQNALGELDRELSGPVIIPALVQTYISETYPIEEQTLVMGEALALQKANPMIFSLDPEELAVLLPTLLSRVDLTEAKTERTQLDDQITKESDTVLLEEIASTDSNLKDLRGRELLAALKAHDFVAARPELQIRLSEIDAKLTALVSLAADPAEAAILETIVSKSNIRFGAEAPASIFADVLARTDTAPELSEETKANVHKLFSIPTVETAGDLQTVLDNGYGMDASGNTLPITADQKLRVFPNTYLYEEPSGDRLFEINVPGNRQYKVRFDRQTSETNLYDSSLTVQIMGLMAQMNLAGAIWQRGWTLQTGGVIDLHYDDVIKAKRVYSLMSGGDAGFDGRLVNAGDQSGLLHRFQGFPSKGDAALGDNDPAQTLADYQELTIVDETGAIDWVQFEEAADYMQEVAARGGQPDFESLKAHLLGEG